jgi:hypothetical protein
MWRWFIGVAKDNDKLHMVRICILLRAGLIKTLTGMRAIIQQPAIPCQQDACSVTGKSLSKQRLVFV